MLAITRQQLLLVLGITAFYLVGQLLVGTGVSVAFLFALAILFGMLAVFAGGGLGSAIGCLNALLIGKFLLFAIAVKIILLEPADGTLAAPQTTALVMATGFGGLFLGTMVQSHWYCPQSCSMNQPFSLRMLLAFSLVLFAVSYSAYFAAMLPSARGEGLQTGSWLGIARALASLKSFAIVPAMLYLWRIRTRFWMTHPLILALLAWGALVGIYSTNKQDAMEPLVFYVLVGFMRYGLRDVRLWTFLFAGVFYYALIIFPYSQYVRHSGGREGTLAQRAQVTKDTFLRILSDPSFRSTTTERVSKGAYFDRGVLSPFGRLAMVGEADKLICATQLGNAFTGWETIVWGFKLLVPSFVSPNKPIAEAGNYLGHIVGEVGSSDTTTQVSYGVMANLFNAFSILGVVVGTPLFFGAFYFWIRLFLGNARWDGEPSTSALWFIWVVASYQHSLVESSLSGLMASMAFPFVIALLYLATRCFCLFLPRGDVQA